MDLTNLRVTKAGAVRGAAAGRQAVFARASAEALFRAGGRALLPEPVQHAVRTAVESQAARVLSGVGWIEGGSTMTARSLQASAGTSLAAQTVRAALRQTLRSIGGAAGAGALIDGGIALAHAIPRLRSKTITRRDAALHVAREAGTGAAATAAGTAAAIGLIAVTGGFAAPAVFLVGVVTSVGAKAALDAWIDARARGAIRVSVKAVQAAPSSAG